MSSLLVILKVLKMILSLGPTRQRGSMYAAPTIHVGWMCQRRELPATRFFYRPPDFYRSGAVRVATAVTAVYR
jgi:hypothetical protein